MPSGTWMNNDGLFVKFGTSEGQSAQPGGEYMTAFEGLQVIELVIDLADLTETETILNDVVWVPNNSHIEWVETQVIATSATGVAIDIGLIDQDRTTEIDYDGLLAAAPLANYDVIGEFARYQLPATIPTGLTGTGALIGKEVTNAGYISGSRTTATAFTTGRIRLRIGYTPKGIDIYG